MFSDDVLIIFVKYPQAGFVKTRLAKEIGKKNASELYRLFVETLLARINPVRKLTRGIRPRVRKIWNNPVASHRVFSNGIKDKSFTKAIFYSPSSKKNEIKRWLGDDPALAHKGGVNLVLYPQKGRELGERLSNAFRLVFKNGAKRVVAIGTDSPTINKKLILDAFEKLKDTQCILGPAFDGGYYLIGLTSFHEEIFHHIDWSSHNVFKQTLKAIKKSGISFGLLDKQFDIDNKDDLDSFCRRLPEIHKIDPVGLSPLVDFINGALRH